MEESDDIYYVRRVREGDTDAFGHIVRKYQRMVFTTVVRIVDSHHDAEDITQEIFIKVFQSLGRFRGQSEFSTWLYRIAYNTTISEVRRRRNKFIRLDDDLPDTEITEDIDTLYLHQRAEILETVLKKLSPDDAQLIMLYYYNKQTIRNIAGIAGLSESNTKVRLHRIRNFINVEINKLLADGRD